MSKHYNNGFNHGVKLACLANGISEGDYIRTCEKQKALAESPVMQQAICKIASCIFHAAEDHETASIYDAFLESGAMMKSATSRSILFDSVLEALSEQMAEDNMQKSAATWLTGLLGRGVGLMPDFLRGGAALSLLAGGGLGAGWWALNRDANSSSAATAAKEEQAKYYRELAKKIRRKAGKLKEKKLSQKDIKDIVDESAIAHTDESDTAEKKKEVADTLLNAAADLYA